MDQDIDNTQIAADIQADTPNEILLAALKLFAEKGYFNTSLGDIAKAADIKATSTIYQHFGDKQAIALKLYESIFDNLNVSIDEIRRKSQKSSEQLHGIVDLFFKLTDDAPYIMQFLLVLNTSEFLPKQNPILETPAFAKVVKIIQSGIRAGEIRNIDPILATTYFFGIINNTLRMVLNGELDKKAEVYQPQTWLAAWNLIAKKSTCF
ncbi:MAG: TetR/AcrR family transcriptional regulator [Methylovulum sp.]|nr:TetR/AcrR family transcriptional regulator [Methylovulum sp.]